MTTMLKSRSSVMSRVASSYQLFACRQKLKTLVWSPHPTMPSDAFELAYQV